MILDIADNKIDLEFHHLGLAVKKPDIAREFLISIGYFPQNEFLNKIFNVYIQFLEHEIMPRIELVYMYKNSNPIDQILKSSDSQIYHTCYKCSNILNTIRKLRANGHKIICVSDRTKEFPFAFYFVRGIGLIELFEMDDLA